MHTVSTLLVSYLLSKNTIAPSSRIDFYDLAAFRNLKPCLKAVYAPVRGLPSNTVQSDLGCVTGECLCRPNTLAKAIEIAGRKALENCSKTIDQHSARAIVIQYCSEKGFVSSPLEATLIKRKAQLAPESSPTTIATTFTISTATFVKSQNVASALVQTTSSQEPKSQETFILQDSNYHDPTANDVTGPIAGGVVGGVILLAAIALFIVYKRRQRKVSYHVEADEIPMK